MTLVVSLHDDEFQCPIKLPSTCIDILAIVYLYWHTFSIHKAIVYQSTTFGEYSIYGYDFIIVDSHEVFFSYIFNGYHLMVLVCYPLLAELSSVFATRFALYGLLGPLAAVVLLYFIQLYWSLKALREGLTYTSICYLQARYRVLYAVIGLVMVIVQCCI